jgi:UDP-N-acetylglucosamine 2-epimerase
VTGNTVVDALGSRRNRPAVHGLITLHRRESFGERLVEIVRGCYRVARWTAMNVYWPVHPNPEVGRAIKAARGDYLPPPNLILVPPMERQHFLAMLERATFVITDSGGVQEEAAIWGVPCMVARVKTDRMETVDSGHAYLLGQNTPEMFLPFVKRILSQPSPPRFAGYDGPNGTPSRDIAVHLASLEGVTLERIDFNSADGQSFPTLENVLAERTVPMTTVESNVS